MHSSAAPEDILHQPHKKRLQCTRPYQSQSPEHKPALEAVYVLKPTQIRQHHAPSAEGIDGSTCVKY